MRMLALLGLTTVLATPLLAQNPADPDKKVAGGGSVPAGWSYRLESGDIANLKFETMGTGLHFTSGPPGIYWREADVVSGSFHTLATFTQTKAPSHPEAYGLFVAGNDLKGANASYVYLIVRGNGMYSIWKGGPAGTKSVALTPWTANDAVVKQDSAGKATNMLEVAGDASSKKLTFKVNGKTVGEVDAPGGTVAGAVGIRMNHNLDVHVAGFAVHKM